MKILSINKSKKHEVVFSVSTTKDEYQVCENRALTSIAANTKIDGFRKGKAPLNVVKQKTAPDALIDKTLNNLTKDLMSFIYDADEFQKLVSQISSGVPTVNVQNISEKSEVTFDVVFEAVPSVDVKNYKKIKVNLKKKEIKEEDIKNEIDKELSKNSMSVPKESGFIKKGDLVTFDFKGYVDKKPLAGGEAQDYELEIGSNSFIPGFEDQMIGLKAGEEKQIIVKFPKDYHQKEIAGKEAKFDLKINSLATMKKPDLNDEFVKTLAIEKVDTVAAYKKHIKNNLEEQVKAEHDNQAREEFYKQLLEHVKLDFIPTKLIENNAHSAINRLKEQLKAYKIDDINEYFKMMNTNEEDFFKQQLKVSESELTITLALRKISELEKISVTKKELEQKLEELSNDYKMPVEEIKEKLGDRISVVEEELIQEKLISKMLGL